MYSEYSEEHLLTDHMGEEASVNPECLPNLSVCQYLLCINLNHLHKDANLDYILCINLCCLYNDIITQMYAHNGNKT